MLEGVLRAALTRDQQEEGFTLSDEEHFLLLRLRGKILKVLGYHSTIKEIREEADKSFDHKGLWCPYQGVLCQEGWCTECQIFQERR